MPFGNEIFIPRERDKESKMLNTKSITLHLKLNYHYEYVKCFYLKKKTFLCFTYSILQK